jgi:hypothetical protein
VRPDAVTAPGPERDAADARVDDALGQDVDRLARAREAGFEHDEADLHTENEERGNQRPHRVDDVDVWCRTAGIGEHGLAPEYTHRREEQDQADGLPANECEDRGPHRRKARIQPHIVRSPLLLSGQ